MNKELGKIVKMINKAYPRVREIAEYPISNMALREYDEANPEPIIKTKITPNKK